LHPAKPKWDGWGYEYKSEANFLGLPLVHISFKYRRNKMPVVARGVISIGQFGVGIINISQFGVGVISISQFTIAGYAIAQIALYVDSGYAQAIRGLGTLLVWLLMSHPELPIRGQILLWSIAVLVILVGVVELVIRPWRE
jgi:hypothetical protein